MDEKLTDYLFDLRGFLVLEAAIEQQDLDAMNSWVDDQAEYVEQTWDASSDEPQRRWIGHIETHRYGNHDGVNFQNIVEGGPVFEKMIDHPAWIELVRKYVNPINRLSIHENLLNVRGRGGHIYMHSGGHSPICYQTFRQRNTGEWAVGQINVLMALEDIGPGDGPTVVVPGSHKATEFHPRLDVELEPRREMPGGTAFAMEEVYLKAGDALFFTDGISHGSAERTNDGHRRTALYRYSPRYIRSRFNYALSDALRARLTPARLEILDPIEQRRPPELNTGRT